jgi:hypothetical protein
MITHKKNIPVYQKSIVSNTVNVGLNSVVRLIGLNQMDFPGTKLLQLCLLQTLVYSKIRLLSSDCTTEQYCFKHCKRQIKFSCQINGLKSDGQMLVYIKHQTVFQAKNK